MLEYYGNVKLLQKFLNAYLQFLYLPHRRHILNNMLCLESLPLCQFQDTQKSDLFPPIWY